MNLSWRKNDVRTTTCTSSIDYMYRRTQAETVLLTGLSGSAPNGLDSRTKLCAAASANAATCDGELRSSIPYFRYTLS